jgi:hypothetical protein
VQYTTGTPSTYIPTTKHVTTESKSSVHYTSITPETFPVTREQVTEGTEASVKYTTGTPHKYTPTTKPVIEEPESSVQYTTGTPSTYTPTTKHVTTKTESSVHFTIATPETYSPTTEQVMERTEVIGKFTPRTPSKYITSTTHMPGETESTQQYTTGTPSTYTPATKRVATETESSMQYTTGTSEAPPFTTEQVTKVTEESTTYTTGTPSGYTPTTKHVAEKTEMHIEHTTARGVEFNHTTQLVTGVTEMHVKYTSEKPELYTASQRTEEEFYTTGSLTVSTIIPVYTTVRAPKKTEVTAIPSPYTSPAATVSTLKELTVHVPESSSVSTVFSKPVELSTSPIFIPESSSFTTVPTVMTSTNISMLESTAVPKVTLVTSGTSQTKQFSLAATVRPLGTCISELDCSYDATCICHKCLNPCDFYNPCAMGVKCVVRSHRPVCLCTESENVTAASVECRTLPGKHKTRPPLKEKQYNETHFTWEVYKTSIKLCTCNICLAILHGTKTAFLLYYSQKQSSEELIRHLVYCILVYHIHQILCGFIGGVLTILCYI